MKLRGALGVLLILVAQHLVTVDPLGIEELLATPMVRSTLAASREAAGTLRRAVEVCGAAPTPTGNQVSRAVWRLQVYARQESATWAAPVISTHAATQQDVAEQAAEGPHCARGGGGTVGAEWYAPCVNTHAGPCTARRTGGRAKAGSHARAHAHAHRRARRGSTLSRRRARVRGTAVCRRTGRSGPPWWTRAYMSKARLRVWPAVVGSWPKRLMGGGWLELPEAPGEPAGPSMWLQKT